MRDKIFEKYNDKSENKIFINHEQSQANSGNEESKRPDFRVSKIASDASGLTIGNIENKKVNENLQKLIDNANIDKNAQVSNYFKISKNLILTDYLNFWRVRQDENGKFSVQESEKVQICTLNDLPKFANQTKAIKEKEKELLEFFELFFTSEASRVSTAKDFANKLALRTRKIKESIITQKESEKITALYKAFTETLYKKLDFEDFADNFAQTLTYTLFLAKLNKENDDKITLRTAPDYIPQSFPLISAMSEFLKDLNTLTHIKNLINEILDIINDIDIDKITNELNQLSEKESKKQYIRKDPYIYFYETFLAEYDQKTRKERGVYYTPIEVVHFIIEAIDSTLKNDFGYEKGLGNALDEKLPHEITLLDFATGTGTFLLEAFRTALQDYIEPNSLEYKDKIKRLIKRFKGFEFLIAPYTIAHLKISQVFANEFKMPLNKLNSSTEQNARLQIYLTNTLYSKKRKG